VLVRQTRENRFVYVILAEGRLVLPASKEWLGILQNRSTYVLSHDIGGDASSDNEENWTLLLNQRQPESTGFARFTEQDHITLVEPNPGRISAAISAQPTNFGTLTSL
jgi:hypothetical protein